jgi:hypothetical protein
MGINMAQDFLFFPLDEIDRTSRRTWILPYFQQNGIGAEFGVFRGHFSEYIVERVKPSIFYMVDIWTKGGETFNWKDGKTPYLSYGALTTQRAKDEATARVSRYTESKVNIVEDSLDQFVSQFESEISSCQAQKLDFAYLDTSHTYKNTLSELTALTRIVRPGGIIAGDDWNANTTSPRYQVCRAVNDFVKQQKDWEIIAVGQAAQYILRSREQ